LQLDSGANTGTLSGSTTLNISGTFIYGRTDSPSFANLLISGGAFRQVGGGTVTLAADNSGFSGALQAYNGTIVQGSATAFGSGGALVIGTPNGTTGNVNGTIIFNSAVPASTVASISSTSASTAALPNALIIPAGVTLTDNGTATVGSTSANNVLTTLRATGGGAIAINGNVTIGQGGGTGTLDLSGLNSATISDTTINIGGNSNGGFLVLANTAGANPPTNIITTTTLNMASTSSATLPGLMSQIILGSGTNELHANTINLGNVRGSAAIQFPAGAPASASLAITDQGGGGAAAMNIDQESGNGPATDGVAGLFLAGHQANVHLSSINMATSSSSQGATRIQAAITFDTGTFTVDGGILMSAITSSGGVTTNGTTASITLGGSTPNNTATGVFTSGGITLGQFTNTNSTTVANATAIANLTINGGTANINGSISNTSNQGVTTSTVNLNSGTLNMNGNSIGGNGGVNSGNGPINFNTPAAGNTATLANLGGGGINGNGLSTSGAGTLILAGNSSYSGVTNVQSGTLLTLGDNARSPILSGNGANIAGGVLVFDYNNGGTDPNTQVGSILTAGFGQSPKFSSGQLFTTNTDVRKGLGWSDKPGTGRLSVRDTYFGDANLDGVVNALDFNAVATNFGQNAGNQVWQNGDFNYDGTVSTQDFTMLAQNFGAVLSAPALSPPALGSLVPEPGSIAMIAFAIPALGRRRRRV
jgi:autotransporter-associated beta strand protein